MKTEIVETKTYKTVYIAEDGKKFDSGFECRNYERTMFAGQRYEAFQKLIIDKISLSIMNDDCTLYMVRMKNMEDYETLIKYWLDITEADNLDEPEQFPCVKLIYADEYYAGWAYESHKRVWDLMLELNAAAFAIRNFYETYKEEMI